MFGGGTGFNFGKPAAPATAGTGSFSFGSTPAATATTGFSFGTPAAPAQPAAFTGTTAPNTGFSFGQSAAPAPVAATATAATGFLFGSTPTAAPTFGSNLFGGQTNATATPTLGAGLFGQTQPVNAAPTALTLGLPAAATPAATPFSFGIAKPPTGTVAPQQTAASLFPTATTSVSLPSLFPAASTPVTAAPSLFQTTLPAAVPAATPSLFPTTTIGGLLAPAASTATPTPGVGFSFGSAAPAAVGTPTLGAAAPSTGILKLGVQPATAATTGFSFGTLAASAPTAATTVATGLTSTASASATTEMTYGQLEEAINKWTVELDEQERVFLQQATQVNAWDRMLIENGEKITNLNNASERLKLDQQRLDHELDFIRAQQRELEELLGGVEQAVEQGVAGGYQQHADVEREHTYEMAESIDAQLKRMVTDLKDIIDRVNSANTYTDQDDPTHQITKILNAHMDSLQWIDQNATQMSRKVDELSKHMDIQRKEHERSFRLAYK